MRKSVFWILFVLVMMSLLYYERGVAQSPPEEYIVGERIGIEECNRPSEENGYVEEGTFESKDLDGNVLTYYHCVKRAPYVDGSDQRFVSESYFFDSEGGSKQCAGGNVDYSKGYFFDVLGSRINLCVYTVSGEDFGEGVRRVKIDRTTCKDGLEIDKVSDEGDSVFRVSGEGGEYFIVHCSSGTVGEGFEEEIEIEEKDNSAVREQVRACSFYTFDKDDEGCTLNPKCEVKFNSNGGTNTGPRAACEGEGNPAPSDEEERALGWECVDKEISGVCGSEILDASEDDFNKERYDLWFYDGFSENGFPVKIDATRTNNLKHNTFDLYFPNQLVEFSQKVAADEHCAFYSFSYPQIKPKYKAKYVRLVGEMCEYFTVSGQSLPPGSSACKEIEGKQEWESCPDEIECTLEYPEGFDSIYFGYTLELDDCQQYVVKEVNEGMPLPAGNSQERLEYANEWVRSCEEGYLLEEIDCKGGVNSKGEGCEEELCGNGVVDGGEECDEIAPWCNDECRLVCPTEIGPNKDVRCRYDHREGTDEFNCDVLEICEPLLLGHVNDWVFMDVELKDEVRHGRYDGAVDKLWEKIHDDFYRNPPANPGGQCPIDVRYCNQYTCQDIKPSQVMSGEIPCGLCIDWAVVFLSYMRTMGVSQERTTIVDMLTPAGALGTGHGVALYKSDSGETWVLDGTCNGGRLYKSISEYGIGVDISGMTDEEIEEVIEGNLVNICSPLKLFSFMDDTSIRKANFDEFPDLSELSATIEGTTIDYGAEGVCLAGGALGDGTLSEECIDYINAFKFNSDYGERALHFSTLIYIVYGEGGLLWPLTGSALFEFRSEISIAESDSLRLGKTIVSLKEIGGRATNITVFEKFAESISSKWKKKGIIGSGDKTKLKRAIILAHQRNSKTGGIGQKVEIVVDRKYIIIKNGGENEGEDARFLIVPENRAEIFNTKGDTITEDEKKIKSVNLINEITKEEKNKSGDNLVDYFDERYNEVNGLIEGLLKRCVEEAKESFE